MDLEREGEDDLDGLLWAAKRKVEFLGVRGGVYLGIREPAAVAEGRDAVYREGEPVPRFAVPDQACVHVLGTSGTAVLVLREAEGVDVPGMLTMIAGEGTLPWGVPFHVAMRNLRLRAGTGTAEDRKYPLWLRIGLEWREGPGPAFLHLIVFDRESWSGEPGWEGMERLLPPAGGPWKRLIVAATSSDWHEAVDRV